MAGKAQFRKKTSSSTILKKPPKVFEIDGCRYKSKALKDLHTELKMHKQFKLIKTFTLPTINDGQKKSKYGALKAEIDGHIFDSVMEAKFYVYVLSLKRDKAIHDFELQVSFELQEKYKDPKTNKWVRPINYVCDFIIINNNGGRTVIDVKGRETADFKLKKKMFGYKYRDLPLICVQWEPKSGEWMELDTIKKEQRKKNKSKEAS